MENSVEIFTIHKYDNNYFNTEECTSLIKIVNKQKNEESMKLTIIPTKNISSINNYLMCGDASGIIPEGDDNKKTLTLPLLSYGESINIVITFSTFFRKAEEIQLLYRYSLSNTNSIIKEGNVNIKIIPKPYLFHRNENILVNEEINKCLMEGGSVKIL